MECSNKYKLCLYFIMVSFFLVAPIDLYAVNKEPLTLATGSEKGVYYAIGQGIAEVGKRSHIEVTTLSSQGSAENLRWLSQGKAQLCLAQSDTAYDAYHGLGGFHEKITNIQTIASLYTEAVHILIRNPLYIKKIEDFKGKRISIGPEGSGTESNALAIFEAAGITPNEVQLSHLNFEESIGAINSGKVDIVFFTSGYPLDAAKILTQDNNAYLFEPHPDILQRLIDIYPFFVVTTIPAGTYAHQDEDVTTVGVATLLLGRSDLDNRTIYTLDKSIFSNTATIANYHKKGLDISLDSALKGVSIPVHDGAMQFFNEEGLHRDGLYRKITTDYILPITLISLFVFVLIKFRAIKLYLRRREFARVTVFLFSIWFFGSTVLYYAEHKINENYSGILLSFWSGLLNWINFGSKEPFTFVGRTTTTVMMVLGVGGIAWLTGQVASYFTHQKLVGGRRMFSKFKEHYVMINWNDKSDGIIDQLRSSDFKIKKPIVVVTDLKESPILKYEGEDDIYHISSNIIDESLLKKVNVHSAHSIILLAKGREHIDTPTTSENNFINDAADAMTVLTILTIRKICDQEEKSKQEKGKVHIVAEILNPQKVKLADYVGTWENGYVEIVSSQYLDQNLLAQVAVTPGLTEIYNDLLTFKKETSEIYGVKIPSQFTGKSFKEVSQKLLGLRDKDKDICIIPIAISRQGKVYVNPSTNSSISQIEDGDTIFVICDSQDVADSEIKKCNFD